MVRNEKKDGKEEKRGKEKESKGEALLQMVKMVVSVK